MCTPSCLPYLDLLVNFTHFILFQFKEMESLIESSGDNGVIVFSLGSYVNHMEPEQVRLFQEAFSELKESVIWRYVGETRGNSSRNTITMPWIPQNDILGEKLID